MAGARLGADPTMGELLAVPELKTPTMASLPTMRLGRQKRPATTALALKAALKETMLAGDLGRAR